MPPDGAAWHRRVIAFVACRRCAVGWAVYLAVAAVIVALYGAR